MADCNVAEGGGSTAGSVLLGGYRKTDKVGPIKYLFFSTALSLTLVGWRFALLFLCSVFFLFFFQF